MTDTATPPEDSMLTVIDQALASFGSKQYVETGDVVDVLLDLRRLAAQN